MSSDETLTIEGKEVTITRKMFSFRTIEKNVQGKNENNKRIIMQVNGQNI